MDAANESGYKPLPDFQDDARDPLIDLNITDSTELWLIQWPKDQIPDFDGQELTVNLHHDGQLGTFEGSSGKPYVVSQTAQEADATVFLSSASESKIVGKIKRLVSFVHYPEPSEVPKHNTKKLKQMLERSSTTSLTNSAHHFATPAKSMRSKHSQSSGRASMLTHGSTHKSSLSGEKESSKSAMRRYDEKTRSVDHTAQDSEHSQEKKSKRRKKHED